MYPALPLAPRGYTLHVITIGRKRWLPSRHIARLMRPDGQVSIEWTTTCSSWWLKQTVTWLRYSLSGLLDDDADLPTYYATIDQPPTRGRLVGRRVVAIATA